MFASKRPRDYVASVDDLLSHRARRLAKEEAFDMRNVLTGYIQVRSALLGDRCSFELPHERPGMLARKLYADMFAGAAILCYELGERQAMHFPQLSKTRLPESKLDTILRYYPDSWRVARLATPETCVEFGRAYESIMDDIKHTGIGRSVTIDLERTRLALR